MRKIKEDKSDGRGNDYFKDCAALIPGRGFETGYTWEFWTSNNRCMAMSVICKTEEELAENRRAFIAYAPDAELREDF